jgi:ferredoxin
MAVVKYVAEYEVEPCTGCSLCDFICPSKAIEMVAKKAVIDEDLCIGCGRCVDRCPEDIMWMSPREQPLTVTVPEEEAIAAQAAALLQKAGIDPSVSVCVCTLTPASEIARSIVKGAKDLEEVSAATGMRSGCGIYCVAPALRLLEAAGADMTPPKHARWYPLTTALWDIGDEARRRYPDAFIDADRKAFDPEGTFAPLHEEGAK